MTMKNNPAHLDLIEAVINTDHDRVHVLLEEGVDPSLVDDTAGITPLHYAAQYNAIGIAKLLIAAGADPMLETDDGQTPLQIAKLYGNTEILNFLSNAYLLYVEK